MIPRLFVKKLLYLPRIPILFLIRVYQKTLSPDHGPLKFFYPHGYCKFFPTCSEYGYTVIAHQGVIQGGARTVWRVLRCNPWSNGGVDLPPTN